MIIGACGFGSTGSSVVSDYLMEYQDDSIQVLDKIEFTWVSEPDGLIDLSYQLINPHSRTSGSITAIRRYYDHYQNCLKHYVKCGGIDKEEFEKSTKTFIDSITNVKWNWYDTEKKMNWVERLFEVSLLQARLIPFIEKKKGKQIKCFPMIEVNLSSNPENFYELAKQHVREVIQALGGDLNKTIVLDQPFSGNNPQSCFPFFDDPFAIVVDRDPRDNYVFAKTRLLGRNHFMAVDTAEDFVKYFRALRDKQPYKKSDKRVLSLQFEELVYDYDVGTKKIRDFLNLPENPNPRSVFDPALSINNTQVWKRFPQFSKDIEYIETELKEYLFDFQKYGDITPTGEMFFGQSPLHK